MGSASTTSVGASVTLGDDLKLPFSRRVRGPPAGCQEQQGGAEGRQEPQRHESVAYHSSPVIHGSTQSGKCLRNSSSSIR